RFFRFQARYGSGTPDEAALAACATAADKIASLSRERATDEFLKILLVDNVVDILGLMFSYSILPHFAHKEYQEDRLNLLVKLQKTRGWNDPLPRLAVLGGYQGAHLRALS